MSGRISRIAVAAGVATLILVGTAATAYAISYLKSEDKIILNDGTELIGSIIFKSQTLVVMMVEGVEKRMWMVDVRKIEQADESTGMVGVIPGTERTKDADAEGEEDDEKQEDGDEQEPAEDPPVEAPADEQPANDNDAGEPDAAPGDIDDGADGEPAEDTAAPEPEVKENKE